MGSAAIPRASRSPPNRANPTVAKTVVFATVGSVLQPLNIKGEGPLGVPLPMTLDSVLFSRTIPCASYRLMLQARLPPSLPLPTHLPGLLVSGPQQTCWLPEHSVARPEGQVPFAMHAPLTVLTWKSVMQWQ